MHNVAEVVTTDTIYQGTPLPEFAGQEAAIVASFHNSLTLLTAEMYGRSFGGGVLELVPSEVARLILPVHAVDPWIERLDDLVRAKGPDGEDLVAETDEILAQASGGALRELLEPLRSARQLLLARRLARSSATSA